MGTGEEERKREGGERRGREDLVSRGIHVCPPPPSLNV